MSSEPSPAPAPPRHREIRGHWVVLGMFAFGITATGILFAYWNVHTAPFRDLQRAIAYEFPRSAPRVDGGKQKLHQDTPSILRIVMRVEFAPEHDGERSEQVFRRLVELAREHHDLTPYEIFEVHLFWHEHEKEMHELELTRPVAELR